MGGAEGVWAGRVGDVEGWEESWIKSFVETKSYNYCMSGFSGVTRDFPEPKMQIVLLIFSTQ